MNYLTTTHIYLVSLKKRCDSTGIKVVITLTEQHLLVQVCWLNKTLLALFPSLDTEIKIQWIYETPERTTALCPWQPTSYFLFHPPGLTVNRPHCGAFVASRGEITSLWSAAWLQSAQRQNKGWFLYKREDSAFWGFFILESGAAGTRVSQKGNTSSAWLRTVSGWSSSSSRGWQGVDHSGGLLPPSQSSSYLSASVTSEWPTTSHCFSVRIMGPYLSVGSQTWTTSAS